MSILLKIHKTCEDKKRYKTEKKAKSVLRHIKKSGRIISSNFRPYKCKCGGWHLGHGKTKETY